MNMRDDPLLDPWFMIWATFFAEKYQSVMVPARNTRWRKRMMRLERRMPKYDGSLLCLKNDMVVWVVLIDDASASEVFPRSGEAVEGGLGSVSPIDVGGGSLSAGCRSGIESTTSVFRWAVLLSPSAFDPSWYPISPRFEGNGPA
jgi:hypothetical protein